MKWLVDAQLPRRLSRLLRAQGEGAIHTLDLPEGHRSADAAPLDVATRDERIVVTKDAAFVASFRQTGRPRQLPLIATGNIDNRTLDTLVLAALPDLIATFAERNLVEHHACPDLTTALLIIHP